jgi:hypothetical protein
MDDYCFRKIKSTALVMIAFAALYIAVSRPLGYYWNALQAELSGVELSVHGVPTPGDAGQSLIIYIMVFGAVALLAFITFPGRAGIVRRLILVAPLSVYLFSAYAEYGKISPIKEKFKDLYESIEYAVFVPYAAIAAVTALYILLVIVLPSMRVTQVFGWLTSVVSILSYLGSAVFIVYNHTMTILDGAFGESAFYTYLAAFALDVASYFIMLSVLMTYCTIKREERWDRLEQIAMEREALLEEPFGDEPADGERFVEEPYEEAPSGRRASGRSPRAGILFSRSRDTEPYAEEPVEESPAESYPAKPTPAARSKRRRFAQSPEERSVRAPREPAGVGADSAGSVSDAAKEPPTEKPKGDGLDAARRRSRPPQGKSRSKRRTKKKR